MRNFLLVCDNGSGEKITIGYRWPLWLDAVDGLTSSDFDVDTEKGNDQDGEHYKSSTAVKRNIVIYCCVKDTSPNLSMLTQQASSAKLQSVWCAPTRNSRL